MTSVDIILNIIFYITNYSEIKSFYISCSQRISQKIVKFCKSSLFQLYFSRLGNGASNSRDLIEEIIILGNDDLIPILCFLSPSTRKGFSFTSSSQPPEKNLMQDRHVFSISGSITGRRSEGPQKTNAEYEAWLQYPIGKKRIRCMLATQ